MQYDLYLFPDQTSYPPHGKRSLRYISPYYLANLPANRHIESIFFFFAKFIPILTKLCMLGLKVLQPNKLQKTVDEDPASRSTLDLDRERI